MVRSTFPAVVILAKEPVTKSIKALNHEGHKGKEKLFCVLYVVSFFSGPFATAVEDGDPLLEIDSCFLGNNGISMLLRH